MNRKHKFFVGMTFLAAGFAAAAVAMCTAQQGVVPLILAGVFLFVGQGGRTQFGKLAIGTFLFGGLLSVGLLVLEVFLFVTHFPGWTRENIFLGFDVWTNVWLFCTGTGTWLTLWQQRVSPHLDPRDSTGSRIIVILVRTLILTLLATVVLVFGLCILLFGWGERPEDPEFADREAAVLQLHLDQMAVFETQRGGIAILDLTAIVDRQAQYRWRYVDEFSDEQLSGTGQVFERGGVFGCIGYTSYAESQTLIRMGQTAVMWSYCSPNASWIYYDKTRLRLHVVSDSFYDADHGGFVDEGI